MSGKNAVFGKAHGRIPGLALSVANDSERKSVKCVVEE
jgi:hypothetical protein